MRDRRATVRRLTVEQWTFLLTGNLLTAARHDESDEDAERRLFGTPTAAAAAWGQHRAELLAVDPSPGRRPYAWWRYERRRSVPPAEQQPELLRALRCLSELEEAQLAAWAAMTPEPPTDVSLDHESITANLEAHDAEATPGKACPETTPTEAVAGTGPAISEEPAAEVSGDAATEQERAKENDVRRPQILFVPWLLQHGQPREIEGWD